MGKVWVGLLIAATLPGCSNRSIYEGVQTSNRNECAQQPPSTYDECMARSAMSYDEYQRQLDAVDEQAGPKTETPMR